MPAAKTRLKIYCNQAHYGPGSGIGGSPGDEGVEAVVGSGVHLPIGYVDGGLIVRTGREVGGGVRGVYGGLDGGVLTCSNSRFPLRSHYLVCKKNPTLYKLNLYLSRISSKYFSGGIILVYVPKGWIKYCNIHF